MIDEYKHSDQFTTNNLNRSIQAINSLPNIVNRNLLINYNFSNPVNRNEKSTYAVASGQDITSIDCWRFSGVDNGYVEILDEYISLHNGVTSGSTEGTELNFEQEINGCQNYSNKTLTYSLIYSGGPGNIRFFNFGSENDYLGGYVFQSSSNKTLISYQVDVPELTSSNTLVARITANGLTSEPVNIYAAKVEVGNKQTLCNVDYSGNIEIIDVPNWIDQYLQCQQFSLSSGTYVGVMYSNPNLFVNPYFQMWQRIPSGTYTGVPNHNYLCDCWRFLSSNGSIQNTINRYNDNGGIQVVSGPNCRIFQMIENQRLLSHRTVTLSVFTSAGFRSCTLNLESISDDTDILEIFSSKASYQYFSWVSSDTVTYAMKLELGSAQTLCHKEGDNWVLNYSFLDYEQTLSQCRRYVVGFKNMRYRCSSIDSSNIAFVIPVSSQLRTLPTLVNPETIRVYSYTDGTTITDLTYSVTGFDVSSIQITATKQNHGLTDATIELSVDGSTTCISCEL